MPTPRNPRFVVIGAGMAGVLSGIRLREAGYDDWVIYEKGDSSAAPGARTRTPGSRATCRPTSTATRSSPIPDWSHRFSPGAEIREYFEGVARQVRRACRASASTRKSTRLDCSRGALAGDPQERTARRGGRRDRGDGRAASSDDSRRSQGLESFGGRLLPQRALGPLGAPRRQARRRDRHGLDRDPDHRRARAARREVLALPAHAPVDRAAGESGLHGGGEGRVPQRSARRSGSWPTS